MKAIGYIRVSTGGQVESGLGLEAQESALRVAAERLNAELHAIYRDEGISGALAMNERPGLLEAVDCLEAGDVLLVPKRDRLGRDSVAVAMTERLVERKGARVISALEEGTNGDDPSNILMKRMVDAFSEYERLLISFRTKSALRAKRLVRGEVMGNPPFGYRIVEGKFVPHAREQRIIQGISILREKGCSVRQIVFELRRHGVVGRRGTPLAIGQVWAVLKKLKCNRARP